jgi:hypothetical protein
MLLPLSNYRFSQLSYIATIKAILRFETNAVLTDGSVMEERFPVPSEGPTYNLHAVCGTY